MLISGEPGVEFDAAIQVLCRLWGVKDKVAEGSSPDPVFEVSSDDDDLEGLLAEYRKSGQPVLLIRALEPAPQEVSRHVLSIIEESRHRIIVTTHLPPEGLVAAARDTATRDLSEVLMQSDSVRLPPLAMRLGDIPLLFHYFIERYTRGIDDRAQTQPPPLEESSLLSVTAESLYVAAARRWPGNLAQFSWALREACDDAFTVQNTSRFQVSLEPDADWAFCPPAEALLDAKRHEVVGGATILPAFLDPAELWAFDLRRVLEVVDQFCPVDGGAWRVENREAVLREEGGSSPHPRQKAVIPAASSRAEDRPEASRNGDTAAPDDSDPPATNAALVHNEDYTQIRYLGNLFTLSRREADIVRYLHMAWKSNLPEVHVRLIAEGVNLGPESFRLRASFSSKSDFEALIVACRRKGFYRLRLGTENDGGT